ncbi:MAG: DUF885 domain-containing protein [Lachnospiraceae bacterium]|nr:DUF885 domain-containing protein [Lachnospiraceae bacterium]
MKIIKKRVISAKQLMVMCILLLSFTCGTAFLFGYKRDEKRFADITSELFVSEMKSNTLNMHYTLAYPENYGIYDYDAVLSCYSAEKTLEEKDNYQSILDSLYEINPDKLIENDRYTYMLLLRTLENSLALCSYTYYDEPLSPASGAQSQLPILLAEYTFRDKEDVEDYLKLLDQSDEYFESLLRFEQEKKDAGLLMSESSLEKVKEQCDTIITSEELTSETHFLQTTFSERLDKLLSEGLITEDEKLAYISENNRLLRTVLLPAYEKLGDGLFILEDETIPTAGLASKPDGAEYYRLYLISQTGSYRDISEIKKLLLSAFTEEWNTIQDIAKDNPDAALLYINDAEIIFPYETADEMLAELRLSMESAFPSTVYEGDETPAVQVKAVSQSLEPYCAPAFYLTAPIDDTDNNVIYINNRNSPQGLELYTTLAHEGYPGHLYQTVFNNHYSAENNVNNVRQLLWYGGYLEGWAVYVEFISYDYASELYSSMNQEDIADTIQIEKHNRSLQLCLYSILDIMINYENASSVQIAEVLSSLGINSASSVSSVYSYIAEEPCNYLKYYLGYLEISELKKQAEALWQDDYSDMSFHTFFLESGPSDFTSLSERLAAQTP